MMQHKNIDMVGCKKTSQNVVMFPKANRIDEKRDIKAAVMARVENVRLEIGETQTEFARRMGVEYKDYKGWVARESIDLPYVIKLAQTLNVSLDYLCCIIDEPHPPAHRAPARDFWSLRADAERARASQTSKKSNG